MTTFFRHAAALFALSAVATFGANAQSYSQPFYPAGDAPVAEHWQAQQSNVTYGVVTSVEASRANGGSSGAGALLGGVVGAVIGRQVAGRGDARTAGTFAGAVAGALIGNHLEKRRGSGSERARVSVQLDRGGVITLEEGDLGDVRVGDRVRIENNRLYRVARSQVAPVGLHYERS
jgi:outer membrane lipoprotein SlyB